MKLNHLFDYLEGVDLEVNGLSPNDIVMLLAIYNGDEQVYNYMATCGDIKRLRDNGYVTTTSGGHQLTVKTLEELGISKTEAAIDFLELYPKKRPNGTLLQGQRKDINLWFIRNCKSKKMFESLMTATKNYLNIVNTPKTASMLKDAFNFLNEGVYKTYVTVDSKVQSSQPTIGQPKGKLL